MTAFPVNVYLLHNLLTVVQLVRQKMGQHLACLVYSKVYWIQIISQMFCGHPQAMNLGNEVKKEEGNMNSWSICEKEPVVNIRTLTSHLLLFLQVFF